mmetsp:Transcript_72834/g.201955  ORF Transcript_72834/g.201955 Transcript_72834/m.201955 type:complete len:208 (+) Transcript_72834:77-700(+)
MVASAGAEMSGAQDLVTFMDLTHAPLDVAALERRVASPACGAVSTFSGITRDTFNGKRVLRLEYEAYNKMALKEMVAIASRIRERWVDVKGVVIQHRLGVVPVTEASIVICVSSPHRVAAMEACRYAIDQVKTTVTVWKKEIYEDGSSWKQNEEFLRATGGAADSAGPSVENVLPQRWAYTVTVDLRVAVACALGAVMCAAALARRR